MLSYIEYLGEHLNMPAKVVLILVVVFCLINVIGEILEFKGKAVPEIIKIRKYFKRKKDDFYCTSALIQTLKFKGAGRAGYVCYVIDYEDENNNLHTKELHTFCSIKSLKPGDKIKINVDRNNPDNIIVVDSDLLIAITICAAGIAFESSIIISYISVC